MTQIKAVFEELERLEAGQLDVRFAAPLTPDAYSALFRAAAEYFDADPEAWEELWVVAEIDLEVRGGTVTLTVTIFSEPGLEKHAPLPD